MIKYCIMQNKTTETLYPLNDALFQNLRQQWFHDSQREVTNNEYVAVAQEWFQSTRLNNLTGWDAFPCVDPIMGCTHFIESVASKHGWNNIQILPDEYSYYSKMGLAPTKPGQLCPGVPLILSLPNHRYTDVRSDWPDVLAECEAKNIDIHIDCAWITCSRDVSINFDHPRIQSFAMSMSKYSLAWNRIGLRWARKRYIDSITIFNHYHGGANQGLMSCGVFMMQNIPRDYAWNTYGELHHKICNDLNLLPTKAIHVAYCNDTHKNVGIGNMLSQ